MRTCFTKSRLACALVICAIACVVVSFPSCTGQQVAATKEQTAEFVAATEPRLDAEQAALDAKKAAGEDIANEQKKLNTAKEYLNKVKTGAETLKVNSTTGELDISATGQAVSAFLPFPWNIAAIAGTSLLAAFFAKKAKTSQAAAESIVESVDVAMRKEPKIMEGFKALTGTNRDQVREALTPEAKVLVDKVSTT